MKRLVPAVPALVALLSARPGATQTCFVYSDTVQANVPFQCVDKTTLSPPCAYGNPFGSTPPVDCAAIPTAGPQTILQMHEDWHDCFGVVGGPNPPAGRSNRWYAFHRQFEHDFNQWRRGIGFAPIESLEWCPGMNLPHGTGPALASHPSGCGTGTPRPDDRTCPNCTAFPQCLFLPGAGPASCPTAPSANCRTPDNSVSFPGRTSLDQFPNVDEVAKILDGQFHGLMHAAVGLADRASTCNPSFPTAATCYNLDSFGSDCSPRDPMFWRLHKALDDVVRAWQDAKAVDVVVVLDRSGSMSEPDSSGTTKFQAALSALDNFADLLEDNRADGQVNQIGVVSFSNTASVNLALTNADATLRAPGGPLQTAVAGLTAAGPGGCTGIGAGLQKAIELLCPPGNCQGFSAAGDRKAILLLTDGMENRPPCLQPAGPTPGGSCGTQCFGPQFNYPALEFTQAVAVGFGNASSLNGDLLTLLAERQGGIYMQNPNGPGDDLKHFFTKGFGKLTDEFLLIDPRGFLAASDPATDPVEYNSCFDGKLTFASGWQRPAAPGELRLLVTGPTGDLVVRGDPGIEASDEPLWEFARVPLPHRGAAAGTWRAQLVRPHEVFVNGFTPDSFVDPAAGVRLVRRQIQRLCPDRCRRVLYFEAARRGPVSVYERALKEEAAARLVGTVEATQDPVKFRDLLAGGRWDLVVYARMGPDQSEPYDQQLSTVLCRGQRAIVSETRASAGRAILRCSGAIRDEPKDFPTFEGDGRLMAETFALKNPGHPVMSYGVRATTARSQPQARALAGKTIAVLARVKPGADHNWYLDVLGRGLSKLDIHHRALEQRTGDELVATVRILPSYLPAGGFDQVDARVDVEYPKVGLGTLLARQRLERERPVAGEILDRRAAALSQVVVPTGRATFPLYDDGTHGDLYAGNAYWSGVLHGLGATDGAYTLRYIFDFTKNGCTTRREAVVTTYVEVRTDPGASKPQVLDRITTADGGLRTVLKFTPADRFGNLWGPGRPNVTACAPEKACRVASQAIVDHGDGSYTLAVDTAPGVPGFRLQAAGATFDLAVSCPECPAVKQLELAAPSVREHSFTRGSVRLANPAPKMGAEVYLESSNPRAATVPGRITIPAGETAAAFEITVLHAHQGPTPTTVSARYGGSRVSVSLTVLPIGPKAVDDREPPPVPIRHH